MQGTKAKLFIVASLFLVLSSSRAAAQGFPWNDFERRTMVQLIKINTDEDSEDLKRHPDKGQMVMRGKILSSVVRMTYTGESQPLNAVRSKFIEMWAGVYSSIPNYAKYFENEFLFKEGQQEYWLPVQKKVAEYFDKELKKDDAIDVYLIRPGGVRSGEKVDWIFLMEEFQKPKEKEWPSPVTQKP
jgi:hypothetical protein